MSLVSRFGLGGMRSKRMFTSLVQLSDLIQEGFIRPGPSVMSVKGRESSVQAQLTDRGTIVWKGTEYGSPSHFARVAMFKKKCNGWVYTLYKPKGSDWISLYDIREKFKKMQQTSPPSKKASPIRVETATPIRSGLIYIFHTRACINAKEEVYKVGKTKAGVMGRLRGYVKGTTPEFLYPVPVHLVDDAETFILRHMRQAFKPRTDYGKEYFEGDKGKMCSFLSKMLDSFIQQAPPIPPPQKPKHWRQLCGRTFRTRTEMIKYLKQVVYPAINRSLKVLTRSGLCVDTENGASLSLDAMISVHRNRWLAWGTGAKRGRVEVLREWASWPDRREEEK